MTRKFPFRLSKYWRIKIMCFPFWKLFTMWKSEKKKKQLISFRKCAHYLPKYFRTIGHVYSSYLPKLTRWKFFTSNFSNIWAGSESKRYLKEQIDKRGCINRLDKILFAWNVSLERKLTFEISPHMFIVREKRIVHINLMDYWQWSKANERC